MNEKSSNIQPVAVTSFLRVPTFADVLLGGGSEKANSTFLFRLLKADVHTEMITGKDLVQSWLVSCDSVRELQLQTFDSSQCFEYWKGKEALC